LLKKNNNNYDVFITYLKELSEIEDYLYENKDNQEDLVIGNNEADDE
jgi:2-phosphoglycerate kinase